jgi:large subunit ribosomal protein L13|tara:strand:- start:180 stop:623 length:444 start_codon:yes stop_codon:yes gene_type:complete
MKTKFAKKEDFYNGTCKRAWWIVDAESKTLGRLATKIADTLRGKHKVIFSPHVDTGDFVIVVNAEKILVTGNKDEDKMYYRHTGYPGGIKSTKFYELQEKHPERIIEGAVKGMMPKNALNRRTLLRLKVYAGSTHPHESQEPQPLNI